MKKFSRLLLRFVIILPSIVIQVLWFWLLFTWLAPYKTILKTLLFIYEIGAIIYIINKREESNYKLLWAIIILVIPFVGTWLYMIMGNHRTVKPIEKRIKKNATTFDIRSIELNNKTTTNNTLNLIKKLSNMPILGIDSSKFYASGEDMFKDMLEDLKSAKKFIFIEYFIIENGEFWDSIVEILKEKVASGVTVKILYDDVGSLATYSLGSRKSLKNSGIDIISFNPVTGIHAVINNRDHRKMMIIDNEICYSGGVNIADEYINKKRRFGHWKDIGFRVTGESVLSYTHMFCLFWNAYSKNKIVEKQLPKPSIFNSNGSHVLSYYDSPASNESVSNNFFINILSTAEKYAYFYTPYLILNDSLKNAFIQASQRNIDVRIYIPGIPDKKHPYMLTMKYAEELALYGIKVFVYNEGFVHAKASLVDDRLCSIGTVNLDYRSLFLHYENNSIFDDENMVLSLKNDFKQTEKKSTILHPKKRNIFVRIYKSILNILSPLL